MSISSVVADLLPLVSRDGDDISNTIKNAMMRIEEELGAREQAVKTDSEVDEIRNILRKCETDLKSQKFGQWAVRLRDQVGGFSHVTMKLSTCNYHVSKI